MSPFTRSLPSLRPPLVVLFVCLLAGGMAVGGVTAFEQGDVTANSVVNHGTSVDASLGETTVDAQTGDTEVDSPPSLTGLASNGDNTSYGEPTVTRYVIELASDGTANWEISHEYNLTSDEDVAAFEDVGQSFEQGLYELGYDSFVVAANAVDETTDREMAVTDEQRTYDVEGEGIDRTGTFRLQFSWEEFAAVDGDELTIDREVLTFEDGEFGDQLWFNTLGPDEELVIKPPEGYGVDESSVGPQNGQLQWSGPEEFDEESLQATFIGDADDDDPGGLGMSTLLLFGIAVFAAIVVALGVSFRSQVLAATSRIGSGDDAIREQPEHTAASTDTEVVATPGPEEKAGTESSTEQPDEPTASADFDDDEEIDVELLSDEERVERLLEQNGGRMKQASIVKETDWSNAKVSQLLSAMEEEGRINKLRIGRENLISFPDEDIVDTDE